MAEGMAGLNLVLLGRTGDGKSSSGNTILGRVAFTSKRSTRSVTRDVAVESGTVGGITVTVYDTPGLFNTHMSDEEIQQMINEKVLQKCESDLCVFLLVIKADRFTEEDSKTVEKIEELLGEECMKKPWILFTRGDELEEENTTIKEFIDDTEPLKRLVQKYDQRYHVFNNKKRGQTEQVKTLLTKIFKPYLDIQEKPLMRKTPKDINPDTAVSSFSSRRIVFLGKTGVGKSASGNTILGQRKFYSDLKMISVTRKCSSLQTTVSGRSVSVVDTPGLFDTQMKTEELMMEIAKSVYISSPGPHAFIIVFPVNMRFTEHEQQIPQRIEMMFGQEVLKYSIILFTHGDQLRGVSVEKLIEENSTLRDLVQQCGGRFHVFNNKDVNKRDQVNDLLKKIDTMIEQNGGGHYSNQMLKDAERFRREEKEQRKQQEEKKVQEEIERVIKETEERFRAEMAKADRSSEEEQRKQDKQRKEEIERVRKETEERIRAEMANQERLRKEEERIRQEQKKTRGLAKRSFWVKVGAIVGAVVAAPVVAVAAVVAAPVAGAVAVGVAVGGAAVGAAGGAAVGAASGVAVGVIDKVTGE